MSNTARLFGLIAAVLMACFSAYIYMQNGDWVAAVFCVGSVGYGLFFFSTRAGNR